MDYAAKLNQTAYYATLSYDADGDETVGSETAITGRWQRLRYVERFGQDGDHVRHEGIFYSTTLMPDGSVFWPPGADQTDDAESYTVRRHRTSPSISTDEVLYAHEVS